MYHPAFTSRKEHAKALMKRSGYRTGGKSEAAKDVHAAVKADKKTDVKSN